MAFGTVAFQAAPYSVLLGVAGLACGIVGLMMREYKKRTAVIGLGLSTIAPLSVVVLWISMFVSASSYGSDIDSSSWGDESQVEEEAPQPVETVDLSVRYEVTGVGEARLAYRDYTDGDGAMAEVYGELPWVLDTRSSWPIDSEIFLYASSENGEIAQCTITVDGTIVSLQASNGTDVECSIATASLLGD
ncbi:hypothetical protein [Lysinibacter sp. HNR]|uniref:hypothetical protein n=1 Tax=Lysinibacter sp. HNR TaxID=3031408 RepID=UPI0024356D0B|nr:hypothetical protein [Lysinibacter sp. HNR]WGD37538.1 hypothetical protein FrondiHNR_01030 [Lysinibacter sp. HNR]